MRCPNCGNENPPDYLFCDECGARLMGSDTPAMPDAPDASAPDAGGGASSGSLGAAPVQEQPVDSSGAMANYADYGIGSNQPMPAAVEQGADTSMGYVGLNNSGSMDDADDDMGLSAVPTTEDTMGSVPDTSMPAAMPDVIEPLPSYSQASADDSGDDTVGTSAYGDAQADFGGIPDDARMSVEEGLADMTGLSGSASGIGSIPDMDYADEEAVPAPTGASDGSGSAGNQWASDSLNLLNQAQSALSSGDWSSFGIAMHSLASTLQTAASGSTASGSTGASTASSSPAVSSTSSTSAASSASAWSMPSASESTSTSSPSDSGTSAPDSSWNAPSYTSASGSNSDYSGSASTPTYEAPVATQVPSVPATPDSSMMSTTVSEPTPAAPDVEPSSLNPVVPSTVTPMATAAPVSTPGASGARLILISTGAEMTIPDQEEITVGREDPSSGIFPDIDLTPHGGEDGGVSRRHARMLHIGDDYFVEDLQSTNFTKLDGQRLPAHVRERLEDGARLDFGRVAMIFRRG